MAALICDEPSGDATGVTCNELRGAAGQHVLSGSQIKRLLNQLSILFTLGRITRFDMVQEVGFDKADNTETSDRVVRLFNIALIVWTHSDCELLKH